MSYTKHNYQKGDELLASQLNDMDDQIALNEQTADTLVTVSNTQPAAAKNRVWVKATPSEIEIPTMDDLDEVNRQINHFDDNLPGTVQTVNFGADGKPSSVVHTKNGATVRTDAYTWGDGTVTETRTTADGSYITMVTDLSTLVTTISEIQEAS